jgi:hypothetical protein
MMLGRVERRPAQPTRVKIFPVFSVVRRSRLTRRADKDCGCLAMVARLLIWGTRNNRN